MLKRGCGFRQVVPEDNRWLWAAYQKGGLSGFPPELDLPGFLEFLAQVLTTPIQALMLEAKVDELGQVGPVGIASIRYAQGIEAWPWVDWFPWASQRNRIECGVKLLNDLNKEKLVLFHTDELVFVNHLARYGLLRPIGWLKMKNGGERRMYQGV